MRVIRKTERRQGEVVGEIQPGAYYDTAAVYRNAGIGDVKLMQEREAGRIKPRKYNGRNWYRGRDLIALIESESESVG